MEESLLHTKQEQVENEFRHLGLYLSAAQWVQVSEDQPPALMATFDVGDFAFAPSTLDKVQHDFDGEFRMMTALMRSTEERQTTDGIAECIARGQNPFE